MIRNRLLQVLANTYITMLKKLCKFFAKERKEKKTRFIMLAGYHFLEIKKNILDASIPVSLFWLSVKVMGLNVVVEEECFFFYFYHIALRCLYELLQQARHLRFSNQIKL